ATGAVVEVSDRGGGAIRVPQSPWRFSESTTGVTGEPRYRGEDNRHVLAGLGYSAEEIDRLESDGVLSSRVPKDAR
ncbi:MAG: CoA transferase, partial [Ilumatobacteraceae bacterium]